jgi:VCBS repeat-containing protein
MKNQIQNNLVILMSIFMLLSSIFSSLNAHLVVLNNESSDTEVLVGIENANVAIDWEADEGHSGSNSTVTDETGYYKMSLPEGQAKASASLYLVRESETIFLYNSSDQYFDVGGDPCFYWKNFTLANKFPVDNATITGYAYNESNPSEKIQADISISFSSYPETETGFYGFNTTSCDVSGGYEINLPANVGVGITATAPGYDSGYDYKIIGEGITPNVNISLYPKTDGIVDCAVAKGYVKNITNGEGIHQAAVSFHYGKIGNTTYTNPDGYYEINLPDAEFDEVLTEAEGYFLDLTMLELNCSETKWLNISLYPGPSDNAWVHFYINDSEDGSSITDAEGTISGEYYECVNQSLPIYEWKFLYYDRDLSDYDEAGGYYNISIPAVIYDEDFYCTNMSYILSWSANAEGYYNNGSFSMIIIEPGDVKNIELNLEPKPEENCTIQGYVYMIGHRPHANNDSYITNEDETLKITEPGVLFNDSDADGDPLTANLVASVSNGILTLNSNGSFIYTPNPSFYGEDSFTYNASDGKLFSNIATVNITINPINDPPVISNPNPADDDNDVPIGLSELSINIEDPEGDSFNWSIETSPDIGSSSKDNEYDGIKTCSVNGLDDAAFYTWYVNATDAESGKSTNVTYSFTTESLNNPPYTPRNPSPPDNDEDVGINTNLDWDGGDPDVCDTVTYDVYFGTSCNPPKVVDGQSGTAYNPGVLNYDTTYFWKIASWDNHGASKTGPVWDFTTIEEPNDPPIISNPKPVDYKTNVSIELTELSINIGDPEGDNLSWSIKTSPNIGSNNSNEELNGTKTCSISNLQFNTTYTWYVNATDTEGSGLTTREVYKFTTKKAKLDLKIYFPKKICIAGVDAKIKNTGEKNIPDINWFISVKGGLLNKINILSEGSIEKLDVNEDKEITTWSLDSRIVRRFGLVNITVEVTIEEENFKTYLNGFVIGRILLLFRTI